MRWIDKEAIGGSLQELTRAVEYRTPASLICRVSRSQSQFAAM